MIHRIKRGTRNVSLVSIERLADEDIESRPLRFRRDSFPSLAGGRLRPPRYRSAIGRALIVSNFYSPPSLLPSPHSYCCS